MSKIFFDFSDAPFLDGFGGAAGKGAIVYSTIGVICVIVLIAGFLLAKKVLCPKKGKSYSRSLSTYKIWDSSCFLTDNLRFFLSEKDH